MGYVPSVPAARSASDLVAKLLPWLEEPAVYPLRLDNIGGIRVKPAGRACWPVRLVGLRRCPTLPPPHGGSTIGAEGLSFRVRDGAGRFPFAVAAAKSEVVGWLSENRIVDARIMLLLIVVVSCRPISTSRLHTSLVSASTSGLSTRCSSRVPLPTHGAGWRPHLGAGFPLRCFQRLSLPNVANQPCSWRNNWHTRGSSVPVLSY